MGVRSIQHKFQRITAVTKQTAQEMRRVPLPQFVKRPVHAALLVARVGAILGGRA